MNDMDISIPSTKQPTNPKQRSQPGLSHVRTWDSARIRTWSPPPSPSRLSGVFPSFHPPDQKNKRPSGESHGARETLLASPSPPPEKAEPSKKPK
ncbi:hypothetical protein QJS10_CPB14g01169 [Acorus calamus]|uniref:Uncharacterized protein n=1 Tax=Acorus calamus TaxID=4465 RepID=A0AAV9DC19_ACOCL|nr:hypothetical protein QJS10_CPB14g01169 [Acorus calamus]